MSEIIFEVRDDEVDGRFTAAALGHGIHTQGESLDELRRNIQEAVACHFATAEQMPKGSARNAGLIPALGISFRARQPTMSPA